MENPEQTPPEGYPVAVSINRAAQLDRNLITETQNIAARGDNGIIQAAAYLEEQLGYTCARPDCLRAVKDIRGQTANKSVADLTIIVPLRQVVFMSEQDYQRIAELPGIEAIDEKYRIDKKPLIESRIEWPENYTGAIEDVDGSDTIPHQPSNLENPSVRRTDGVLTHIHSTPVQESKPKPVFTPPRPGVRR